MFMINLVCLYQAQEPADMLKEEIFNHPGRKFLQAWKENGIDNLLRVFRMKDGVAKWWTMEKNFESKEYIKL